jgi:hypothetical protein
MLSNTRVFGQKGATGATSLIIKHLRCNIWCNIPATRVQHFAVAFPKPSDGHLEGLPSGRAEGAQL